MSHYFRLLNETEQLIVLCRPLWERIRRRNKKLASQLENACMSANANTAEGSYRYDGNRRRAFSIAAGEARETKSHIRAAVLAGYVNERRAEPAIDKADKIAATLYRCLNAA